MLAITLGKDLSVDDEESYTDYQMKKSLGSLEKGMIMTIGNNSASPTFIFEDKGSKNVVNSSL